MKTKISIWQKIKRSITAIILCIFIIYYFRYKIWLLFKNQLIRIPEFIFTKFAIGTIISMNILFIFRYKIISLIEIQIDNFIYTNFSSYYDWAIFITSLIFLVSYLTIKLKNKYVFSNNLIIITICILLSYIFYKSQFLNSILSLLEPKYYDIIPVSCLGILVISFINKNKLQRISKRKQQYKKNNLLLGKALKETESDILNYGDIARQITEEVIKINNEEAFAIGITKSWGSGKTTFLNYLEAKIKEKDEDSIIIKFSPWYSKSEIDIITLFFTTFSKKISKYHSSINNQLIKYLKLLLTTEKNIITKSIDNFLKLFQDNKDISDLYKDINQVIKDINRKIYIVIDDIDRLYASEIIECLKIIRNTANFNNVIYFVAYDPIYVQNAINKEFGEDSSKYIDKIIQLTFELPEIEDYNIIEYLRNKLSNKKDGLSLKEYEINKIIYPIYSNFNESNYNKKLIITEYFTNFRDCNKVIRLFITYKNLLKEEVILSDLFLVCILRCLYPKEALIIYNRLDDLFDIRDNVNLKYENHYYIEEKKIEYENKINQLKQERKIEILKNQLNENNNKDFSKQDELKRVQIEFNNFLPKYLLHTINNDTKFINLVNCIFNPAKKEIKSSYIYNNYRYYYNGVISKYTIRYDDFLKYIESKQKIISEIQILDKNKYQENGYRLIQNQLDDFQNKLQNYIPLNIKEYEIKIFGLVSIILLENINNHTPVEYIKELKRKTLNTLILYRNRNFPNIIKDIIDFYKFNAINNIDYAYEHVKLFEVETKKIILGLLEKEKRGKNVFFLFDYFKHAIKSDKYDNYDYEALQIIKEYKDLYPVEFLKNLIYENDTRYDTKLMKFNSLIIFIFPYEVSEYGEFEKFLYTTIKNNPQDKELQEIREDWEKYKNNNYEYFTPSNKKYNLSNQ